LENFMASKEPPDSLQLGQPTNGGDRLMGGNVSASVAILRSKAALRRKVRWLALTLTALSVIQFAGHLHAGAPLPFHTIEGVGGCGFTPMAYLVNPGPEGAVCGKPAGALTYVNMGAKNLNSLSVTETLFGRVELGYCASRLGLGNLPSAIRDATSVDIGHSDVWLHNFNARLLLVKENTCLAGLAMPAVTFGAHIKVNDGIRDINRSLNGAFSQIGYNRENGEDFTLTCTKTFVPDVLGRPVILTAGLRESQASQVGYLGFSDTYHSSFEGSVVFLPRDWLVLAYEFRQKSSPYGQIAGLIGREDSWHGFHAALIMNPNTTFSVGYGLLGNVAETEVNNAWCLQLKHEF
jgi:hypothetical protein